jgi:hypothetical protein
MRTIPIYIVCSILLMGRTFCVAQKEEPCSPCRRNAVLSVGVVGTIGSYYLLDQLWYSTYPRTTLHSFDDSDEWLQMDKAGHMMTCYTIGRYGTDILRWSGMDHRKSMWLGGSAGFIYMTGIEILDGKSSQWGFSWSDMIANAGGSLMYIAQENFWKEQRIVLKISYTSSPFAEKNPEALGRNFQQRLFKDYNAQTYWSSINVSSFLASDAAFPRWLNVAIGYGATEMLSAKTNNLNVDNSFQQCEFYLSFDADLVRVRWKKKWMQQTAKILSFIKLPSPTLEVKGNGRVKMHGIFF